MAQVHYGIPPRTHASRSTGRRLALFAGSILLFALSWIPVTVVRPELRGAAIFLSAVMWGLCVFLMVAAVRVLEEPDYV